MKGQLKAVAVLVAALAVVAAAAVPALAGSHARQTRHVAVSLRTLVDRVHVRSAPTRHAHIVGTIRKSGTAVAVSCYTMGSSVAGNPVWYRISAPENGYITSYYTATHLDPVAGVSRCKAFSRPYRTVVKGLHVRVKPTTRSKILVTLGQVGTRVMVNCYDSGQAVSGDAIWYHLTAPKSGYVAGLNLNTGADPASGVPRC